MSPPPTTEPERAGHEFIAGDFGNCTHRGCWEPRSAHAAPQPKTWHAEAVAQCECPCGSCRRASPHFHSDEHGMIFMESPATPSPAPPDAQQAAPCESVSARWCHNCGSCTCGKPHPDCPGDYHDECMDHPDCPLHGKDSRHAEEPYGSEADKLRTALAAAHAEHAKLREAYQMLAADLAPGGGPVQAYVALQRLRQLAACALVCDVCHGEAPECRCECHSTPSYASLRERAEAAEGKLEAVRTIWPHIELPTRPIQFFHGAREVIDPGAPACLRCKIEEAISGVHVR